MKRSQYYVLCVQCQQMHMHTVHNYITNAAACFGGHKGCGLPLTCYTLYDHKTNDYIHRELRIAGTLDKIDEYRRNWFSHLQRMPQNRIPLKSYRYRPQQLEDRRSVGASSCNSGDGTDQRVQSLMFMMIMIKITRAPTCFGEITIIREHTM